MPPGLCSVLKAIDVNSINDICFGPCFEKPSRSVCGGCERLMNPWTCQTFVMRVMKINHETLVLVNFYHNTWHRHSSQKPMSSGVTRCYGYGSTKASSSERIKRDFRWIQNELCPRRNPIWPFTQRGGGGGGNSDHESFMSAWYFH